MELRVRLTEHFRASLVLRNIQPQSGSKSWVWQIKPKKKYRNWFKPFPIVPQSVLKFPGWEQKLEARIRFLAEPRTTSSTTATRKWKGPSQRRGTCVGKGQRENHQANSCENVPLKYQSSYSLNLDISFPDSGILRLRLLRAAVGLDNIFDLSSADGTAGVGHPLELEATRVAKTHVSAGVDDRVHRVLVADWALVRPRTTAWWKRGRFGEAYWWTWGCSCGIKREREKI